MIIRYRWMDSLNRYPDRYVQISCVYNYYHTRHSQWWSFDIDEWIPSFLTKIIPLIEHEAYLQITPSICHWICYWRNVYLITSNNPLKQSFGLIRATDINKKIPGCDRWISYTRMNKTIFKLPTRKNFSLDLLWKCDGNVDIMARLSTESSNQHDIFEPDIHWIYLELQLTTNQVRIFSWLTDLDWKLVFLSIYCWMS
jgi:hypothetical protein